MSFVKNQQNFDKVICRICIILNVVTHLGVNLFCMKCLDKTTKKLGFMYVKHQKYANCIFKH